MITETKGQQGWSNIITEELGVQDKSKLTWMSKYASVHELFENAQSGVSNGTYSSSLFATPLNTMGMGNPAFPQQPGTNAQFHAPDYKVGSGDVPMSTLPIALNVAAMTIGLELVPVIPADGPWTMLSYLDYPYAGGKLGRTNETAFDGKGDGATNKPIYIKISADNQHAITNPAVGTAPVKGDLMEFTNANGDVLTGTYLGKSRIDGNIIIQVSSCTNSGAAPVVLANISIADFFAAPAVEVVLTPAATGVAAAAVVLTGIVRPQLVSTMADHVDGFANFYDGGTEPMSRAENETGTGNILGLRLFTKVVEMKSYEVTGQVTRQQLQDLPLYGVDAVGKLMEAAQNEISQSINKRILERVFRLGVTNAAVQKQVQNVDLNLFIGIPGNASKALSAFGIKEYVGVDGVSKTGLFSAVVNSEANSAAENLHTRQRRIMSRVLAATNLIQVVGRRGRASWIVTNAQIASALQDSSAFIIAPMANTLSQNGSNSLYFAGTLAGLSVFVDPNMAWDDNRICVGRKGDGNMPGVIFTPYILADTVQTIVEGTMAPKILVNSRFAIVDAGFNPEFGYLTFGVFSDYGII